MKKIIILVLFICTTRMLAHDLDYEKLKQAGENLKESRTLFWMGLLCSTVGTTFMLLGDPDVESSGGLLRGDFYYNAGVMINVAGFVCYVIAWQKIGKAGEKLATAEKR